MARFAVALACIALLASPALVAGQPALTPAIPAEAVLLFQNEYMCPTPTPMRLYRRGYATEGDLTREDGANLVVYGVVVKGQEAPPLLWLYWEGAAALEENAKATRIVLTRPGRPAEPIASEVLRERYTNLCDLAVKAGGP